MLLNSAHMELNKIKNHAENIELEACRGLKCVFTFCAFEKASSSMAGLRQLNTASSFYTLSRLNHWQHVWLSAVSLFHIYRNISSQYRTHITLSCWYIHLQYTFHSFQDPNWEKLCALHYFHMHWRVSELH